MSRGMPSMTALLALVAVAGYQNRDKIAEMLGQLGGGQAGAPPRPTGTPQQQASQGDPLGGALGGSLGGSLGGLLGGLGGLFGGAGGGGGRANADSMLGGGLSEMLEQFGKNGYGEAASSWVGTGANKELPPADLEQAIGPDVLDTLSRQTGLSREELLSRLSRELPKAVDMYTPEGRLPGTGTA